MPPKKSLSKQRQSTRRVASINVPIYEILTTKEIKEPLLDIMPQIERALKEDPLSLKASFLNMLARVCGLEEFAVDIDFENTLKALQEMLEKACQIKTTKTAPLILQEKDKFHKEFIKRLSEFIRAVISDEIQLFNDQKLQFNQSFLSWLQILTKSKLRPIRKASIKFTRILLEEEIILYDQSHEKRQTKKAFTISKSISYYLEKILSPRFIDIDQSIRETAFETAATIMEQLQGEVITEQLLHKMFTYLFEERIEVIDPFLKLMIKSLERCKNTSVLIEYLKEHVGKLIDLSRKTQFPHTNMLALRIVQKLHHSDPTSKLLNRNYMVTLLETYAPHTLLYALHIIVQVFYQSLYQTQEQLESNAAIVLIQVLNLLMGVSNKKCMPTILAAFFNNNKKITPSKVFSIDNMFNLLLSESYRNQRNSDVKLESKEIQILITVLIEWIKYTTRSYQHAIKDKPIYEKILQSFNTQILVNCKQLFFEKMGNHPQFSEKYLTLFAQIHCPTLNFGEIENYIDFVCSKAEKLFEQNLDNTKVYKEIVNLLHNMSKDQKILEKYSAKSLIKKLPLLEMTRDDGQILTENVFRVSALFGKFPIQELTTSENFMNNLIDTFAKSGNDLEKIEMITIFHFMHHFNFMELFVNTSETQLKIYKAMRTDVLRMYLNIINNPESISVKLSAFRALVFMLKMISNKRFEQNIEIARFNAFELPNDDMKLLYEFVSKNLFDSDSMQYTSMDLSKMLQRMSFETHEVKAEIIRLLFDLFESSYAFTCNVESVKFLITMIKAEHDLHREFSSKTLSLPMSIDLTKNMENKLNQLLGTYFNEEVKETNNNKLIYWRLCFDIFSNARDDEKFDMINEKLLTFYFSKRKIDPHQRDKAKTKIMIFILHAIDKILERKEYIQLDIYENIFRKISRKVPKQTLIRVKEFLIEKTEGISSHYVKNFLETLESLAKVNVKKDKKVKEESDESDSERSDQENDRGENEESDEEREVKDRKVTNRKGQQSVKPKSKNIKNNMMEVQENESDEQEEEVHERVLRSRTKRKVK